MQTSAGRCGGWNGSDAAFLELLTKMVFATGFSRAVVERRWPAFREAFARFDPAVLAEFDERTVELLLSRQSGIVRNARKVRATLENARICAALAGEYGSLAKYCAHVQSLGQVAGCRLLAKAFRSVGDSTAQAIWRELRGGDEGGGPCVTSGPGLAESVVP